MVLELQKAFKMETRKLLWLIGLLFATVLLFQRIELPKGIFVFSRSENPDEGISSFFSDNDNKTSPPMALEFENPEIALLPLENSTSKNMSSFVGTVEEDNTLSPGQNGNFTLYEAVPPVSPPVLNSSSVNGTNDKEDMALPPGQDGNFISDLAKAPVAPEPMASSVESPLKLTESNPSTPNVIIAVSTPPPEKEIPQSPDFVRVPAEKPRSKSEVPLKEKEVFTLSDMNELLIQAQVSPNRMVPRWPAKVDEQLAFARSEIENAHPSNKDGLYVPLYHNASMFQRSYELMEQMLKVYIYKEGDRRIFHKPPLEGIYASEGWFMKLLEENRHFVTKQPQDAHLFYLPFSSRNLEEALYVPNSHSHRNLALHLKGYVEIISALYPFWNRTYGVDHFLVACHDWAPSETKRFMANCIRALCNADVKEGFKFGKDVSLPETYVRKASNPGRGVGGRSLSKRKTLAFFAGNMHGYLRPILLQHWGTPKKEPDMQIYATLPRSKGNRNYIDYMKSSKYCLCPRGYEVNSPRVVEAIFYECVPVIISDNFVPPFFETLNWESFAVIVAEKDIPNLKKILLSIPERTYLRMHMRVKKVQQHFLWHPKPVKYDLFHMILHSVWYNRVFQFGPRR